VTKPTARELLGRVAPCGVEKECPCNSCDLVSRVEKVLTYAEEYVAQPDAVPVKRECLRVVLRILNRGGV